MQSQSNTQAIVLGGSMAGMLAARVLSRHFDRVVLVERDIYPEETTPRSGVPQARHLHALLMRGHDIIEALFPGITEEWVAAGAEVLDVGEDFAWRTPAGWGIRFHSGIRMLAASRPLMDHAVARRVAAIENVAVFDGATVTGLVANEDGRITGVRLGSVTLNGDLVVDASGRMSRVPEWLADLGCEAPTESVIDAQLGYATRLFRRRPEHQRNWKALFIQAAPPDQPRAGIAFPVEGRRWIVTLCGGGGEYAPTNEREFLEFARGLPSGEVYNLIRDAEPLGPIVGYRRTENRWRHYECVSRFPDGLVILGDAVCGFNPVYGQGITTAALEALALDEWVRKDSGPGAAARFQADLARLIATPWAFATGEDLHYKGVQAPKPGPMERLLHSYVRNLMGVSTYDQAGRLALLRVFSMLEQPQHMLRPAVLAKVARHALLRPAAPDLDVPVVEDDRVAAACY